MATADDTRPDLDLLVVGAGPAGIAAALTANAFGLSVLVIDRAVFPRDKTCGDGLTAGALRHLERFGVEVPQIPNTTPVQTVMLRTPNGRLITLPLPKDGHHAVVTPRRDLDAALVSRAREKGVTVVEGRSVTAIEVTRTGVTVTHGRPAGTTDPDGGGREGAGDGVGNGDGVRTRARFVVAADGHYSAVRRLIDPSAVSDLGSSHAFRQYFHGVDNDRLWVLFEPDLLPGYAWVFPLPDGRANVGFGVARTPHTTGKALAAVWRDLLARPALRDVLGPNAEPEATRRAWPIPATFDPRRCTTGRVLYAGDAASVVDPMTGEGIAQALESGTLAATAVAEGGPVAAVATRYRQTLNRALGRDLRVAQRLLAILRTPRTTDAALSLVDATPWTRRNFARWMFEDYPRSLLFTPHRWSRGAFTPPGAYRAS